MGNKPKYIREGGSIPAMAMFKKRLGIDTTVFGFGLDDDFVHAPNERCARPSIRCSACQISQCQFANAADRPWSARPCFSSDSRLFTCRMRHSFFNKGREAYIKLLYALGGAGAETAGETIMSSKDEL